VNYGSIRALVTVVIEGFEWRLPFDCRLVDVDTDARFVRNDSVAVDQLDRVRYHSSKIAVATIGLHQDIVGNGGGQLHKGGRVYWRAHQVGKQADEGGFSLAGDLLDLGEAPPGCPAGLRLLR